MISTISPAEACAEMWDVAIVGAGPAGATAALRLAQSGLRTLILNRERLPRDKVCGCCLSAPTVDLLSRLGFSALVNGAPALKQFRLHSGERSSSLELPSGRVVSRQELDLALTEAAIEHGAKLLAPAIVLETQPGNDCRVVRFRSAGKNFESRAKVVIVADGVGGTVMRRSPQARASIKLPLQCGVSTTIDSPKQFLPHCIHMFAGNNGYLGAVRMAEGELRLAGCFSAEALKRASPGQIAAALLESSGFESPLLQKAVWNGTGPLHRSLKKFADERLFVIGDAASYTEPFTGEGIAWGLVSAIQAAPLAIAAAQHWTSELSAQWQRTYENSIQKRQRISSTIGNVLKHLSTRHAAIWALSKFPRLGAPVINAVTRRYSFSEFL